MTKELDKLQKKIDEFNEQAKKEGRAISDERLKEILPGLASFEPGNFGKRPKKKF